MEQCMSNTTKTYDSRYLEGIRCFNEREYFEAHEVWEDLWKDYTGPARHFYQGLIQVAVCLHHFGNGNAIGARKLYYSSHRHLDDYPTSYLGLDLEKLLADLQVCCAEILANEEKFPKVKIRAELIPKIDFNNRPA
jgi:predicted metal-dependent hydrolase